MCVKAHKEQSWMDSLVSMEVQQEAKELLLAAFPLTLEL